MFQDHVDDNNDDNNKENLDVEDFDDDEDFVEVEHFSVEHNIEQLEFDDENNEDIKFYKKYGSTQQNLNSMDAEDHPDIRFAKKGSDADTNLTNILGGKFQYRKTIEGGNCALHFYPALNWWNALSQDRYGPEVATHTGCQHGLHATRGFKKDGSPKGRKA